MEMKRELFTLFILLYFFQFVYSDNDLGNTISVGNCEINNLYFTKIDSFILNQIYKNNLKQEFPEDTINIKNVNNFDVFEQRLLLLNNETPIELEYNDVVKKYINLYLNTKKDLIAKMLGISKLYFPLFEETLDKYDLPLELKYLAIVESALNPLARSKSGAIGLWQFMYNTGNMLGLNVTSYIDERRDPIKSTEAACNYFAFLYNTFNDWQLALAAYNGGPSVVRKAIIRSGGKTDYWNLRPYLPEETRGYVPAFIAVSYMMNYAKEHNIEPVEPKFSYLQIDTVVINQPVLFSEISSKLNIPISTLKFLNPTFKQDFIPQSSLPYVLVLPANRISDYLKNEKNIATSNSSNSLYKNEDKSEILHIVKKGEYLSIIALEYSCSIDNIKKWNNLQNDNLSTGQGLIIYVPKKHAYRYNNIVGKNKTNNQRDNYIYYILNDGDNLSDVVSRLSTLSLNEVLLLNNYNSIENIEYGTKLKIGYKK